jgi:hypothetical protein
MGTAVIARFLLLTLLLSGCAKVVATEEVAGTRRTEIVTESCSEPGFCSKYDLGTGKMDWGWHYNCPGRRVVEADFVDVKITYENRSGERWARTERRKIATVREVAECH